MATITPILDRIVVKRDDSKQISTGGIVLAGTGEKPCEGTVIAVGPGKYDKKGELQPMHLTVGDKILFGKFAGTEVTVEEETFIIMREEDILCILK